MPIIVEASGVPISVRKPCDRTTALQGNWIASPDASWSRNLLRITSAGGQSRHRLGRRVPRERCDPCRRRHNPPRGCCPFEKSQTFVQPRPIGRPAFRHRNAPGIGLPGLPAQGTLRGVAPEASAASRPHSDGRQFLGYCRPGTETFVSKAALFVRRVPECPVACASRPGIRPFLEGRWTLSQGSAADPSGPLGGEPPTPHLRNPVFDLAREGVFQNACYCVE